MQGANVSLRDKRILLVVSGGIAAYKTPDLVRRLREEGARVQCVMTKAAHNFITATTLSAVSGTPVATELFDPMSGLDVGHIRMARDSDLIIVAPATAGLIGRVANGLADDLATAILLARDVPALVAPAMNPKMWDNPATQRNVRTLEADGYLFVGPEAGEMAESGEAGVGRMAEPMAILEAAKRVFALQDRPLMGFSFLVTSGPTQEPLDPVRYISNRSSGKQGHAIAEALIWAGATVQFISGPVSIAHPKGAKVIEVTSATEMLSAVEEALPVDCAIFAAAVADWRAEHVAEQKIKKVGGRDETVTMTFARNPDILATIGHHANRPKLVVGFAAETENLLANARSKLVSKGADWILANDVSAGTGVFGGESNHVHLVAANGVEDLGSGSKVELAEKVVQRIVEMLKPTALPPPH
jgi:phosphopantothenoylcysteine decarboxylase / phosphopantothenate---cysteine ligase